MPNALPFPPDFYLASSARHFDETGVVSVPLSSSATVVTVTVPHSMVGILMGVGIDGGRLTNWAWCRWRLMLGGVAHPSFNNVRGMVARFLDPLQVYGVCKPNQRMELVVENLNAGNSFQYAGRLVGFFVDETRIPSLDGRDLRA